MLAGHEGPISGLMFNPSHPLLVSGSWDKTVRLWKMFDSKVSWETLNLGCDGKTFYLVVVLYYIHLVLFCYNNNY